MLYRSVETGEKADMFFFLFQSFFSPFPTTFFDRFSLHSKSVFSRRKILASKHAFCNLRKGKTRFFRLLC